MVINFSTESTEQRRERARKISKILRKTYQGMGTALTHRNPFELLIATILSAQCTDEKVNQVTPILFEHYPTPATLAAAPAEDVEKIIHATGFFRQKAKSIQGASQAILDRFGGKTPEAMEDLTTLPGVGRKTANVVRGNAFGLPGLFVDTHVKRLSLRMGLTEETDPEKVEAVYMDLLAPAEWTDFANSMIWHGRRICIARKPQCPECPVLALCEFGQAALRPAKAGPVSVKKRSAGMGRRSE